MASMSPRVKALCERYSGRKAVRHRMEGCIGVRMMVNNIKNESSCIGIETEVSFMLTANRTILEKALLLFGGIAAGYALKEVIDDVIENLDAQKRGPIVYNKLLTGKSEEV